MWELFTREFSFKQWFEMNHAEQRVFGSSHWEIQNKTIFGEQNFYKSHSPLEQPSCWKSSTMQNTYGCSTMLSSGY
jgi:hypothetical protein